MLKKNSLPFARHELTHEATLEVTLEMFHKVIHELIHELIYFPAFHHRPLDPASLPLARASALARVRCLGLLIGLLIGLIQSRAGWTGLPC